MIKIVGTVTENEKLVIKEINDHKSALEELLIILPHDSDLYKQAADDLKDTLKKYQEWWKTNYNKYNWEKGSSDWKILFETNEIIINE